MTFKKKARSCYYIINDNNEVIGTACANPYRVNSSSVALSPEDKIKLTLQVKKEYF